jgi:hypothetical protein
MSYANAVIHPQVTPDRPAPDPTKEFAFRLIATVTTSNTTPDHTLTPQALTSILTMGILAHTSPPAPRPPALFSVATVTTHGPPRAGPNGVSLLFHVTLLPTSPTGTPPDLPAYLNQIHSFISDRWWKLTPPNPSDPTTPRSVPSPDPWALAVTLLYPACNSFDEHARGLLLGIPPDFFETSRWQLDLLVAQLFTQLLPFLPSIQLGHLNTLFRFQCHVGFRAARFQYREATPNHHRAYFIATSSEALFLALLPHIRPSAGHNLTFYGAPGFCVPFPRTPADKLRIGNTIGESRNFFHTSKCYVTDQLRLLAPADYPTALTTIPGLRAFAPLGNPTSPSYRLSMATRS